MVHGLSLLSHSVNMRRTTSDNEKPQLSSLFRRPKISSFDPDMVPVRSSHPTPPLASFFHSVFELASGTPCS